MNSAIGKAIKKRDSLFHIAKCSRKPTDRAKYDAQRNKVVSMIRQSKQLYFDKMDSADSSNFWKFVRCLNQKQSLIPTLQSNDISVVTSTNKATMLNNYLYSCFNINFPPLQNNNSARSSELLIDKDCPKDLLCTEDSIFDLLISHDTTKSVESDGIFATLCAFLHSTNLFVAEKAGLSLSYLTAICLGNRMAISQERGY